MGLDGTIRAEVLSVEQMLALCGVIQEVLAESTAGT